MAGLQRSPEYGGKSGTAFDIDPNVVPDTLKGVTIRSNAHLCTALAFVYTTKEGDLVSKGPYGGSDGVDHEINFSDDEIVTRFSGYYGKTESGLAVIRSLTVFTSMKPDGYGPFGANEGTPFRITGDIVAFFGHSGTYLYGVGAYVKERLTLTRYNKTEVRLSTAVRRSSFRSRASGIIYYDLL